MAFVCHYKGVAPMAGVGSEGGGGGGLAGTPLFSAVHPLVFNGVLRLHMACR